jgi:hypothetical protein
MDIVKLPNQAPDCLRFGRAGKTHALTYVQDASESSR